MGPGITVKTSMLGLKETVTFLSVTGTILTVAGLFLSEYNKAGGKNEWDLFRFRFAKPEAREILLFSGKQIYNKVIVNQNAEDIYGGIVTVKLADISNGPDWLVWAAFIILAAISAVLISGLFENILPANFAYVLIGLIISDVIIIIILSNTFCRKWQFPVCREFNIEAVKNLVSMGK